MVFLTHFFDQGSHNLYTLWADYSWPVAWRKVTQACTLSHQWVLELETQASSFMLSPQTSRNGVVATLWDKLPYMHNSIMQAVSKWASLADCRIMPLAYHSTPFWSNCLSQHALHKRMCRAVVVLHKHAFPLPPSSDPSTTTFVPPVEKLGLNGYWWVSLCAPNMCWVILLFVYQKGWKASVSTQESPHLTCEHNLALDYLEENHTCEQDLHASSITAQNIWSEDTVVGWLCSQHILSIRREILLEAGIPLFQKCSTTTHGSWASNRKPCSVQSFPSCILHLTVRAMNRTSKQVVSLRWGIFGL